MGDGTPRKIRLSIRTQDAKPATDLHGFTRINQEQENEVVLSVRIRENPCKSVASFYLLTSFAHLAKLDRNGYEPCGEDTVSSVVLKGCMWP